MIFLVDEDDAVRDALAMALRAAGHAVAAFASARHFINGYRDAYRHGDRGCLVVDMDVPEGGAEGLLRALAAAEVILPAIIMVRHLRRCTPIGGLLPGRILFLEKPFGVDELLRLVRLALGSGGEQPAG